MSLQEVFAKAHKYNSVKAWGVRAAGWGLMFLSIWLTVRIIYTLGKDPRLPTRSARRSRLSLLTPLSSHSGLGSSPPRAGVRRADDLCHVRLHLPVAAHHRSGLALLQAADGRGPGSAGRGSGASGPLQTSSQEERVTSSLMSIPGPRLIRSAQPPSYSKAVS